MGRLILVVVLTGCWSTSRRDANRTDPERILLRRQDVSGDVFAVCGYTSVDVTVTSNTPPTSETGKMVLRTFWDERTLGRHDGRLRIQRDDVTVVVAAGTKSSSVSAGGGSSYEVDDRNRPVKPTISPPRTGTSGVVSVNVVPDWNDLFELPYPAERIQVGTTFDHRVQRTRTPTESVPVHQTLDLRFVVLRISPATVELGCRGALAEHATDGVHRADAEMTIDCRVDIDRRDGRSARWWIDLDGSVTGSKDPDSTTSIAGHIGLAVGRPAAKSPVCQQARSR